MRNLWITLALIALIAATGCSDSTVTGLDKTIDTAPPAAPTALQSAAGSGVVKLSWRENTTDADLAGYMVYRVVGGRMLPLTDTLLDEPVFVDHEPWRAACRYAVTAVDLQGNESAVAMITHDPYAGEPDRGL